jgi:hypothetical protein
MQSRIFEIALSAEAESHPPKKSPNRHVRFATEFVDLAQDD